ncbi:MAG TPA: hypothetical protein VNT27_15475, partial [Propionibacteriaceae bacterium]|nr:hypothetical protein [Propionibacteriaceae bacterium]
GRRHRRHPARRGLAEVQNRGSLEGGWYGVLQQAPTDEVRVISEEYGLCGRFHRSPASNRWHTAPEEVHLWGVRPRSDESLF